PGPAAAAPAVAVAAAPAPAAAPAYAFAHAYAHACASAFASACASAYAFASAYARGRLRLCVRPRRGTPLATWVTASRSTAPRGATMPSPSLPSLPPPWVRRARSVDGPASVFWAVVFLLSVAALLFYMLAHFMPSFTHMR